MAAFNKINRGDVLFDCHRKKMGNTKMSQMVSYEVRVLEVDTVNERALCSKNGNPAQWYSASRLAKLRRTPIKA